jgi:hypothetical protein
MLRYIGGLLLLPALFLAPTLTPIEPSAARAQRFVTQLPGTYQNVSNGGFCYVYGQWGGYVFVNENGSQALFQYAAPGQLRMVQGEWDPSVVASVGYDAYGRPQIRFDSPYSPTGYWVKVN